MKRLAALALSLSVLPLAPVAAADPMLATWIVERVSASARTLEINGGAGARDGEHAFAAVASATATDADGALFFGVVPDSNARVSTPAGDAECRDLPVAATACATKAFGAIGFVVWWDDATFDKVFVVLHGRDKDVDVVDSPGWRLRRWRGPVRVVTDADVVSSGSPAARGAGAFNRAESWGGSRGSVAIGKLPCLNAGYTNVGAGAATLTGGTTDKVATCADWYPPAAAARGGTEWVLDGAAAGASDTLARLVVVDRP